MSHVHAVRACLITNPKGGRGGIDLAPILPVLAAHGWDVTVRHKQGGGHATELAREAAAEGYDVVVAAGGDGTVGEVIDGLVGTDVAVGVLPGGTANLWSKEIGVSGNLAQAALQLVGAQRRRIDVGHLTINGKKGQHFLLMAGLGLDAAVVSKLDKGLKKRVGMLAYVPAIGKALPQSAPFAVRVDLDGVTWQGEVLQIVIGNTRRYANVTSVTPDAYIDDGRLDVALLTPSNPVSAARQLSSLIVRNRPMLTTALLDRVSQLTVRTLDVVPLQTDGGRVKQKNVTAKDDGVVYYFTVRPHAVTVLVPRDYSGALFQTGPIATVVGAGVIGGDPTGAPAEKPGKRWFEVVAVGIDTITVARLRDGRVMTARLTPETIARDAAGDEVPLAGFLDALSEGQRIHIKGKKIKDVAGQIITVKELRL
jgi:YegS/Rv2252/BmrU family lipid kinase